MPMRRTPLSQNHGTWTENAVRVTPNKIKEQTAGGRLSSSGGSAGSAGLAIIASVAEALDNDLGGFVVIGVVGLQAVRQHEVVNVVPSSISDNAVVCPVVFNVDGGPVQVMMCFGRSVAGGSPGTRRRCGCG